MGDKSEGFRAVDEGILVHDRVDLVFATPGPHSHFFGYYDNSPFDAQGRRLLCHSVEFDGRMVKAGDRAEIGLWDLTRGSYSVLAETGAFNWQQGSLLQWLPAADGSQVVFNDRAADRFVGVRVHVGQETRTLLPTTVCALTPDGRWSVTPRFERLYYTPGYHYEGLALAQWEGGLPAGDALLRMDLQTGTVAPIVDVARLARHRTTPSMAGANHYVSHISVAPSGREMIFLHRWKGADKQPLTRLYRCDLDGSNLRLYPDSGRYSHTTWLDGDRFLVWGRPLAAYARLRTSTGMARWLLKPFLTFWRRHHKSPMLRTLARQVNKDGYLLFAGDAKAPQVLAPTVLTQDGHPSACPASGEWLLLDTYPDQENLQHLLLYHLESGRLFEIARVYAPPAFQATGFRCDLHPR
ncbi:MAG: hypothetical protein EHM56_06350, partial [Chloroflexi bacterium]